MIKLQKERGYSSPLVEFHMAITTAMEYRRGVGECPHAEVEPLHPVPQQSEKRYRIQGIFNERLTPLID
jgi:hypothetical protein